MIDPRRWINIERAIKIKHDEWNGETKEKVHYPLTIDKALEITSKHPKNYKSDNKIADYDDNFTEPNNIGPKDDDIPFI